MRQRFAAEGCGLGLAAQAFESRLSCREEDPWLETSCCRCDEVAWMTINSEFLTLVVCQISIKRVICQSPLSV
jgi:hypothetical protein